MHLIFLPIHPLLSDCVHSFWLFESEEGLPVPDRRLVVPNGHAKIIINLRGELHALDGTSIWKCPAPGAWLTGLWDKPVILESLPGPTMTIGMEFLPQGVERLFTFPFLEVKNKIIALDEVLPGLFARDRAPWNYDNQALVSVRYLETMLLDLLDGQRKRPWLLAWAIQEITRTRGNISIHDLEKESGYCRRAIDLAFRDRLGLGPKTLASIVRFQVLYRSWARNPKAGLTLSPGIEAYADQSHLIREFKRFSGFAPGQFSQAPNEFGRLFYQGL